MALKCTKRSLPPSSGVMKPYPFSALNHLTVPVAMFPSPPCQLRERARRCRGTIQHTLKLTIGQECSFLRVTVRVKPRLRGVFHEGAFYLAISLAVPLSLTAEPGRARISAIVFSACLAGCFGASALYHRPTWTPLRRAWLARLDHAGIYLLIAGPYTPFGLLVLSTGWAIPVLSIVYAGAALAILTKLFWVKAPKPLSASIALVLGWVGIAAVTQLVKVGAPGFALVV